MKRKHRLAARMVAPLLAAARAVPMDVPALLRAAELPAALAGKSGFDDHVSLTQYFRLWELALTMSGVPDLPLRAATALGTDSFGVIGFTFLTSATVADACAHLARYYGVLSSASRWLITPRGPMVDLVFEIEPGGPLATRCAIEFALAECVHFAALLAGRRVAVAEVQFPHPPPPDQTAHQQLFQAPLRWRAPRATLVVPRAQFEIPLPKADPHLLAFFRKQADALAAEHAGEEDLSARVRRLVTQALPTGAPNLPAIARGLGLSERSLRRHLGDEGTSFQALVEQIRSELAKRYLHDPKLNLSEIAFLIGFSELSPFQRAFRRWTGTSPGAYRAALDEPAS